MLGVTRTPKRPRTVPREATSFEIEAVWDRVLANPVMGMLLVTVEEPPLLRP
jgi:hypothetical protein